MATFGHAPRLVDNIDLSPLEGLDELQVLDVSDNDLTMLSLPDGLTGLAELRLGGNDLSELAIPSDLMSLATLNLTGNAPTALTIPDTATNLTTLLLKGTPLTELVLPEGMTNLRRLDLTGHSLTTLVIPESLREHVNSGVLEITGFPAEEVTYPPYPTPLHVASIKRVATDEVEVTVDGPGGVLVIEMSTDLESWPVRVEQNKPAGEHTVTLPVDVAARYLRFSMKD